MVVTRSALMVIGVRVRVVMGMRHAVRAQRDLRMLKSMDRRGHGQKGQTGEPPSAEITAAEHLADSNPPLAPVKPWNNIPWGLNIDGNDDVWFGNFWARSVVLMAGDDAYGAKLVPQRRRMTI